MPPARRSARTASSTTARDSAGPYTRANGQPSPSSSRPTASITRGANGSSLKLKVKAPSSKLKQVTGASDGAIPPNPYADLSESDATPQPAGRAARQTRNPRTVVEPDTDEDMEDAEDEEEEGEDEDEEMEDDEGDDELDGEEDGEEDSEEDAEGEDEDEDELASDAPPPPIIRQERPPGKSKPNVTITAPPEGPLKSVEAKEMEDEEDEELSELESNPDADEDEEEEDDDSDEDLDNSRSATPDLTKLTKRQRGAVAAEEAQLLELSNEAQKKKHLTAEEQVMRRTEMARRRKNLSEKRNEEEKVGHPSPPERFMRLDHVD